MTGVALGLIAAAAGDELLRWAYAILLLVRPAAALRGFAVGLVGLLAFAGWRLIARHQAAVPHDGAMLIRP